LLALVLTPIIVSGGIDLSVGSMMGLAAVVLGGSWLMARCTLSDRVCRADGVAHSASATLAAPELCRVRRKWSLSTIHEITRTNTNLVLFVTFRVISWIVLQPQPSISPLVPPG
jgi:ribose/xylose/arabinose/galactoside ABC-type transport system permease subunit